MKKLLPTILALTSTSALAHPGHLTNEKIHGFLHIEHIIMLAAIGIIAFMVDTYRNR